MKKYVSKRWICVQEQNNGNHWYLEETLSYTRRDSIKVCIKGGSLSWKELKKYYWSCIKVQVTFDPITHA